METTKRFETRGVLAGAYTERNPKSLLTHAVEVDANRVELRVLCSRVLLDSICDPYGCDDVTAVPTCPVCAKRLAKLK